MEIKQIQPEDTYNIRHKVMWAHKPIEFVKVDEDTEGVHFGLFEDNQLISVVSLFYKNDAVQFRKFATLSAFQSRGFGTHLLKYIFQLVEKQGIKNIWCNARIHKTWFYTKFGMKETSVRFMKEGLEYVVMERVLE